MPTTIDAITLVALLELQIRQAAFLHADKAKHEKKEENKKRQGSCVQSPLFQTKRGKRQLNYAVRFLSSIFAENVFKFIFLKKAEKRRRIQVI